MWGEKEELPKEDVILNLKGGGRNGQKELRDGVGRAATEGDGGGDHFFSASTIMREEGGEGYGKEGYGGYAEKISGQHMRFEFGATRR